MGIGTLENKAQKRSVKTKEIRPEKIFLWIGIVFGLLFALLQPLFIEPDASFHFDKSTYLSNTVVDRAKVGMPAEDYQSAPVPFTTVSTMMKNGTYFKNFFETKLPIENRNKVADQRVVGTKWYMEIMHWIPALGVKIGHLIYPSIGSMILTARIFNLIFFLISMFWIIKKLKAYKMLAAMISLTPTVMQFASSLSYDCFNYVAVMFMIATLINLAVDFRENVKLSVPQIIGRLILPSLALYLSKTNSRLVFLLLIVVIIALVGRKFKLALTKLQAWLIVAVLGILGIIGFVALYHQHLGQIVSKFFYTLLEPYYTVLTTEVIGGTNTVGLPAWLFPIQFSALILLFLSYSKERLPRWFAWSSLTVFAVNLFGVLLQYAASALYTDHTITGVQGRYFTPFLLLLAPAFTLLATKITVKKGKWLSNLIIIVTILTLFFNLSLTSVKFYHLQLPADEYRSGVEHYIFK